MEVRVTSAVTLVTLQIVISYSEILVITHHYTTTSDTFHSRDNDYSNYTLH